MKNKKTAIRLVAALILIVTMMFSLSSCIWGFDFSLEDYLPEGEDNYNPGNQGGQGGITPPGNNIVDSENYGEFYPGSGQSSMDGVSPLTKTMLSTVTVISNTNTGVSMGSGVIYKIDKVKGDAYVITNRHVVQNANSISVYLYGMHLQPYEIPAVLVGGSITYDIALLKISGSEILKNSYACAANFANSEDVRVFDRVYAVGNSEGNGLSATEGIVSVESESITVSVSSNDIISLRVIRVDAAVNRGNSGGGLYDTEGKLVGIVSAKEISEDIDNMGYAIPSNLVKKLVNSIIYYCDGSSRTQINKAFLGVTITSYVRGLEIGDNGDVYEVELVEVIEVASGSLAQGSVRVGDIINSVTVDGVKTNVKRAYHMTDAMIDAREGSTVVLNVTRGNEKINLTFMITSASMSTVK